MLGYYGLAACGGCNTIPVKDGGLDEVFSADYSLFSAASKTPEAQGGVRCSSLMHFYSGPSMYFSPALTLNEDLCLEICPMLGDLEWSWFILVIMED
jgi:hypothetical protein